jgi:hypothetical protein
MGAWVISALKKLDIELEFILRHFHQFWEIGHVRTF